MTSVSTTAAAVTATTTTYLNYWNAIAFTINCVFVFGSQHPAFCMKGMKDNATLSKKYQTLITPSGYAFSIWGIIFLAEFGFIISQLFFVPASTSSSSSSNNNQNTTINFLVDIVGYKFIYACLAQSLWSICFGYEYITASFVCMVTILGSLLPIVYKIFTTTTTTTTSGESDDSWWLNEFPMEIHCGWIMAATLVNLNVFLVSYHVSSKVQIITAYITLATVLFIGVYTSVIGYTLFGVSVSKGEFSFVIPCVMAWASIAISKELQEPNELIATQFSPDIINSIKISSKWIGYFILFCNGVSFVLYLTMV
jgi:benzodiazapine receptor